jgi:lon-related putative ATP-dependent protease
MHYELPPEKLRREYDPERMPTHTTKEISPFEGIIGQDRAVRALKFGLDIGELGYNVYAAGMPGTGRTTAVKDFLEELAKARPPPSDWCYVNNFSNTYEPIALKLPPGKGRALKEDMADLISGAKRALPKAFEGEDYSAKKEVAIRATEGERTKIIAQINMKAKEEGFVIQISPVGLLIVPVVNGRPLSDQEFMALSPQTREAIEAKREKLGADLRVAFRQIKSLDEQVVENLEKVDREATLFAIGHLVSDLMEKYKDFPEVTRYIQDMQNDILENHAQFLEEPQPVPGALAAATGAPSAIALPFPWLKELPFRKYEVNVLVDNSELKGAPVVVEPNPTYPNLFGRIEKEAQFGVLTTDFTLISAGSLHRANGGYLVLPVEEVLRNPFSWDGLKMALKGQQVRVEEPGERAGYIAIKGLRPSPVPLSTKVILIGNPLIYQLLYTMDPDFQEIFKVKADFDTTMDRTEENMANYASFVCTFCEKTKLKHLDREAVAKVIEYGSRLAEDQEKLSTRFADIADIIREANFYAAKENSEYVTAAHLKKAIDEKVYRSNLIQKKIQEMIERSFVLINTEGEATGQVNGLSVIDIGDFAFGRPSRVTASTAVGREGIVDIEREAMLGGPIHTKGVMILSGYLSNKYAQDKPLSLSARLVFEQSYEGVEGDSASSTELYAIISSLSSVPIKQNIAVTGSVNQRGEVQAIGGVNEKIEGYFEVCKAKGLTGKQGVMIPESNVQNLMLKEEVVEAVKAGKFHIYSVKTIDDGIEVLTGVKAGNRLPDGKFEKGSVHYRADIRLGEMAEKLKEYREAAAEGKK